jgi:multidrug resistance efflux pump
VPENDLKYFKIGQTYKIIADAFPDKKRFQANVIMIAGKAIRGQQFSRAIHGQKPFKPCAAGGHVWKD